MEKVQADVIKKKKIDTKNLTENLLVIFVILCPVFDILGIHLIQIYHHPQY